MIIRLVNPLSLAAMAAILFTACEDSPTSPRAVTSAEARADLEAMAAKVKYFAPQGPNAGSPMGEFAKRAAAKAGAGTEPVTGCDRDATEYDEWETDSTDAAGATIQYDTTVSYTAAGVPLCDIGDEVSYEITSSRSVNSMYESRFTTRMDYPADYLSGDFKLSGKGTVRYADGYLITVTSMDITINSVVGIKTYVMNLDLEKGYSVVMKLAPGVDLMSEDVPGPNDIVAAGPITKDGAVVGYFEVLGDDRVVIRDADRVVIESHG